MPFLRKDSDVLSLDGLDQVINDKGILIFIPSVFLKFQFIVIIRYGTSSVNVYCSSTFQPSKKLFLSKCLILKNDKFL